MRIPGSLLYQGFRQGLRNPRIRPWIILGVLVYLLSPIDLLPSYFLGVGEIDDLLLVSLLIGEMIQIGRDRGEMSSSGQDPRPSSDQGRRERPVSEAVIDVQASTEPD